MLSAAVTKTPQKVVGRGRTLSIVAAVLTTQITAASPAADEVSPRVRSTDRVMLKLLKEGRERSGTFRTLVDAIDHSNVIVYVEFGYCAFGHLDGCLLPFLASTHGDRYVRIVVTSEKSRLTHDDLLALIGHELQHALEVLEHPEVIDVPTMEAMYGKIGIPVAGQRGFETSAARAAGTALRSELISTIQLPPGSVEHLMRRSYVVDGSVEAARVIERAISKLPPEVDPLPLIIVVGSPDDKRYRKSDPQIEAFVIPEDNDHVYVTRWGNAFRAAGQGRPLELAGALAHEAWHLQNGPEEGGAYDYQLRILQAMHASPSLINQIGRAKENAVYTQEFERRSKSCREATLVSRTNDHAV
jgi:hypothetical protein